LEPFQYFRLLAPEDFLPEDILEFTYYYNLLQKTPDSQAVILAGFDEAGEGDGLLVACDSGSLIIEIDSLSHFSGDTLPLWENMIDYALTARFDYLNK
jgi:hypothetical protein